MKLLTNESLNFARTVITKFSRKQTNFIDINDIHYPNIQVTIICSHKH